MRVEDRVIPARFLVTIGHLIAMLMVFKTKVDNVYAGLGNDPTAAQVAAAKDDVDVRCLLQCPQCPHIVNKIYRRRQIPSTTNKLLLKVPQPQRKANYTQTENHR